MPDPDYDLLKSQLIALLRDESDALANASNFVGLLFQSLDKGVCGTAAANLATLRVEDVHKFPGHIVCDAISRSELVVPLLVGGTLAGVLDIDSPTVGRFSAADQAGIEMICATFCELQAAGPAFI